jgi:hypothetical protein
MNPRIAAAVSLVALAACAGGPPDAAVAQLALYKSPATPLERIAGETGEAIGCRHRHAVCADLWLARAEASLALSGPAGPADRRTVRIRAAAAAAAAAAAHLPPDGRSDLARRALAVLATAGRSARDAATDPAAQAAADADLLRLAEALRRVPGGEAPAAWFATEAALATTLRRTAATDLACPDLLALRDGLPPDPPPDIAAPVGRTGAALDGLIDGRGCRP